MKVLCIEESIWRDITPGKWYTVIKEDDDSYRIIDDRSSEHWYPKYCFKTQTLWREEKLKELGI